MLVLVLGDNLPVMFVGWEGVGLCSYLLIGFWYTDNANADAGKKAFIVNRIGDFGFLLGMFLLFQYSGTMNFTEITVGGAVGLVADAAVLAGPAGGVLGRPCCCSSAPPASRRSFRSTSGCPTRWRARRRSRR